MLRGADHPAMSKSSASIAARIRSSIARCRTVRVPGKWASTSCRVPATARRARPSACGLLRKCRSSSG